MKKIISSILAASFIFATCAINVMAAPVARTVSIGTTAPENLEVGSEVIVEVTVDPITDVFNGGYDISFDPDVFTIDTGKTKKVFNFFDTDWYNLIKNVDDDTALGYYLKTPTSNANADEGWISLGWSGDGDLGEGVSKTLDSGNVVGKFKFTVKSIPESGESTISFNKASFGKVGENTPDTLTLNNATVKFKTTDPDPEKNEWNIAIAEEEAKDNNKLWKITPEKTGTPEDISKFDITFKAADTSIEPLKKSLRTEVLNKIADSWNTGYNFYIGLKVKTEGITGVTADWDIAAGSSTVNVNK